MVSGNQPFWIRRSVDMVTIPTYMRSCIKVSYATNVAHQLLYYIIIYYIILYYIILYYNNILIYVTVSF